MTLILLTLLVGCPGDGDEMAEYWSDELGGPARLMDPDLQESYDRGREVMDRVFSTETGLGPSFNADSCGSCHQAPVAGGSGPRYRDFFLVYSQRFDGTLQPEGTNGTSPVRNLYATAPNNHLAEPDDTVVYARRNAPSGLGIGLFAFVSDEEILSRQDILDDDGDGISGRANFEDRRVGRFGYKSQAATLESFNRGAMINQMGVTSDPLFYEIPGAPDPFAYVQQATPLDWFIPTAFAQVAATGQPTVDDDGVPDPEMSNQDQEDLLVFSTFVAPPPMSPLDATSQLGEMLFGSLGCEACHVPSLPSTVGRLPAYTDLLLHDMGNELDDDVTMGLATGNEWRTAPLWAVSLHGPYLHDGRADSLHDAIALHGGESTASRDRYLALPQAEQDAVVAFLESLGGGNIDHQNLALPDVAAPVVGQPGGPVPGLTPSDVARFEQGRRLFDQNKGLGEGLGTHFNADSCRACHRDPVLGGAGGADTSVIRIGQRDLDGVYSPLESKVLPRMSVPGELPARLPDAANVIEMRNPPTVMGVGHIDSIDPEAILALADPDDLDGDGISGRARILSDGRLGKYGWKANVPTALDFVADALLNENGITIDPSLSPFTGTDTDGVADPELPATAVDDLTFFLMNLAPPVRREATDADAASRGEGLFTTTGCADCHVPSVDGVEAYSDFLLHDIAPDEMVLTDQEEGVLPTEFRTAPLWGVGETGPWLHSGQAETLADAVLQGHYGEASSARENFEALDATSQNDLIVWLNTL